MFDEYPKKRALVVDDFGEMRRAIRRMLEAFGVRQISEAANGEEAMERLMRVHHDIVLCDYNLGDGKDGQEVLEEARERGLLKGSDVFLMITAETSTEMVLGAVDHKPDGYLSKPFTRNALKMRLDRALAHKHELRAIEAAVERGDLAAAAALCDERIAAGAKNRVALLKRKAEIRLQAGDPAAAREVYEGVLGERDLPWARLGLGQALYELGDYAAAEEVFQGLVETQHLAMEAYDWLARTREALERPGEAQQVMMEAVRLAPKSLQRHRHLGGLAFQNKDLEVAERAYRATVRLGRHAYGRSPEDHERLAMTLVAKGDGAEALKVLAERRSGFPQGPKEARRGAVLEGAVLRQMGRVQEAEALLAQAIGGGDGATSRVDLALEQARLYARLGDRDRAVETLTGLVRNHHDDQSVLDRVQAVFKEIDLDEEGGAIISSTREELVGLNNRGVRLVQDGRLDEAVQLFREAAEGLPENRVVNLNAAQVLLQYMREHGVKEALRALSEQYLARVQRIAPEDPKYLALQKIYQDLAA